MSALGTCKNPISRAEGEGEASRSETDITHDAHCAHFADHGWIYPIERGRGRASISALLLFPNAVDAHARVDVIVHDPVGALAPIGQRTRDLLKAGVERKVVPDRVLEPPKKF